jgi:hypothetical protein
MRHHNTFFQVSLSNGETIFEGKGDYKEIEGQPSPWQRLLLHLRETKTHITSLAIYSGGRRYMLPPMSKGGPNFVAFQSCDRPVGFSFFRKLGQNMNDERESVGSEEIFAIAQAQFDDGTFLEIWVSNDNPDNAWTLRAPKSSMF